MKFEYHRGDEILDGFRVLTSVCQEEGYAIYRVEETRYVLCVTQDIVTYWLDKQWITDDFQRNYLKSIPGGYGYMTDAGYKVYTPQYGPYPDDWESVEGFCRCFQRFVQKYGGKQYPNVVYIEQYDLLLPLETEGAKRETSNQLIGQWLTDGLPVEAEHIEKVRYFCDWLTEEEITSLVKQSGISETKATAVAEKEMVETTENHLAASLFDKTFYLPGRKKLSKFFEQQIIDFFRNKEAYERMGIKTVPAFLLYGCPGSGKTYAVEELAKFLQFPCFEINSESVASSYIHATSKKVAEIFQKAMEAAPSILIIDELESYLSERKGQQGYHVEEVDEFLRNIPKAIEKQVIVVGMTNHLDMIDAAVLRKGRFDQIIEVEMPSQEEIIEVLQNQLESRPTADDLRIEWYAKKLVGHPLSDVAFLVREASRRTVRLRKEIIDDSTMSTVLQELCSKGADMTQRRIGF